MGINRGPNLTKDNLVFGYDAGYGVANTAVPTRFYKGKPTVNMLTSGDNFANWNKTQNSGNPPTITSDVAQGPFDGTLAYRMSIPTGGSYPRLYQYYTPASTATHTFSVWLKAESPGQGVFVGAFRNSPWALPSSTSFTITDEWVNYSLPINPQDTTSMQLYIGSHDSHKGKEFLIYGAQLEASSDKSPFVDGTRSDTASLIDLKRTTNIDTTNISFDSLTGQPHFDGTDDKITLSHANSPTSNKSFEMVVKFDSLPATNSYKSIWQKQSNWNQTGGIMMQFIYGAFRFSYGDHWGGSATYGQANFTTGKYYHIVGTVDNTSGANAKLYLNGILVATGTGSQPTTTSVLNIGEGNGGRLDGPLDVFKMYSETLTQEDVTQNFNAYKNRFNI